MTVVYEVPAEAPVYEGAPEVIFERSLVTERDRRGLAQRAEGWAADGLRVLAVAERTLATLPTDSRR